MRTVRGIPECSLPNGRRFAASVTHTCEDEDSPYVEPTFVDVAPGLVDILLRPRAPLTTVFSIQLAAEARSRFPRIRAWWSTMRRRPFAVPSNDVSIHESCMRIRIRGYFDTKFAIRFNDSEIMEVVRQLFGHDETTGAITDVPWATAATNNPMHVRTGKV